MDVDELLLKAWKAVEKSGVPESLYEVAFKEAVGYLRTDAGPGHATKSGDAGSKATPAPATGAKKPNGAGPATMPDETTFFSTLATESGVPETDLRDVLNLTAAGQVQVTTPTKDLGKSKAAQAKTVIALVAGARANGLGERPVSADAVRTEIQRKGCWDGANFSAYQLGPMKGFNSGSDKTEIVLTSKWVDEFRAAIATAKGETPVKKKT
jgi:hypothetical protein